MLLRSLSAESQSLASKPRLAEESFEPVDFVRAIGGVLEPARSLLGAVLVRQPDRIFHSRIFAFGTGQ